MNVLPLKCYYNNKCVAVHCIVGENIKVQLIKYNVIH